MKAKELFGHWDEARGRLLRALDLLSDEQLGFVPREGLWSLGTVARHIAGAEEGFFRYVITHERDGWPDYTAEAYPTVAAIKALLGEVHARTDAYLAALDAADLERVIQTPWGSSLSLRSTIWGVIEHEISHRGEIYLMLGLMGIKAPDE
jgi:uncharacterized damage-inducible protein DinB